VAYAKETNQRLQDRQKNNMNHGNIFFAHCLSLVLLDCCVLALVHIGTRNSLLMLAPDEGEKSCRM
jgi:hypothetical protein